MYSMVFVRKDRVKLITVDYLGQILNSLGGQADVILLDFSKAFDKVPHNRLCKKL